MEGSQVKSWICRRSYFPEAAVGGPLQIVMDGDPIEICAIRKEINILIRKNDINTRMKKANKYKPKAKDGALKKYAKLVCQADVGATTH